MDTNVVVTGASRGIGAAVVESFAEAGAAVTCCSRDREALTNAVGDLGDLRAVRADVRDEFDVERLMERAARDAPIEAVVACAGVMHGNPGETPLSESSYSAFDDQWRTNVRGVFATVREALPHLADEARVVVPTGPFAERTPPGYGAYGVSKAGAAAVTQRFAAETDYAIGAVDPGKTATDLTGGEGHDPADAAAMVRWAVSDLDAEDLDGAVLTRRDWRQATR